MKHRPASSFLPLLLATVLGVGVARAELRLGSDLSQKSIPEGETTTFLVRVVGDGKFNDPVVKTDESVKVESAGTSQSLQIRGIGGVRQVDVTYSYLLTPSKKGTFSVHAEVPIEGDALLTETSTLTVRERTAAEKAQDPFVKISLDRTSFYVGETVPFEVTAFLRQNTGLLDIAPPTLDSGNFVVGSYGNAQRAESSVQGFQAAVFNNTVSALKPGEFQFGPATVRMAVREQFGMRLRQRAIDAVSEPVTLTIKALPTEGKPDGFTGAVGQFTLGIDASPLKLHLGEPIQVELRVGGSGNFGALTLPEFTSPDGWKPYPPKKVEIPNRQSGEIESISFTQVMVPATDQEELPPFRLSFFDPIQEKYITLETDPIPLEITADPLAASSNGVVTSSPESTRAQTPDAKTPTENMDDILTIVDANGHHLSPPPARLLGSTTFWVAQSLPLGALAGMLLVFVLRRKEPEARPATAPRPFADTLESLRTAPASLPALDFYARARACLESWEYHHPGLAATNTDAIAEVRERHDFLHYAGNAAIAARPVDDAERRRVLDAMQSLPTNTAP